MEQTLPPLVSDKEITRNATAQSAACMKLFGDDFAAGERARGYVNGAVDMKTIYEADRAKTREVVQALVDALRNADRYGNFRNEGPYHFNPDSDQHALQKFEAAAIALAKSQLQIEPTK